MPLPRLPQLARQEVCLQLQVPARQQQQQRQQQRQQHQQQQHQQQQRRQQEQQQRQQEQRQQEQQQRQQEQRQRQQQQRQQQQPPPPAAGVGERRGRRQLLLRSALLPLPLPLLVVGSDDATTIINSVLSGYGLPTLTPSAGFRSYDEFADDYFFDYPRSWVTRRNSMRPGVVISDFKTADKLAVEVLDAPADGDVQAAAVTAVVVPPGRQEDATLSLPPARLVKSATAEVDGQAYTFLAFPSETVTRSGYAIKRKNFCVAALRRGRLYVLSASARSDQYNDAKRQTLERIVESFRLR